MTIVRRKICIAVLLALVIVAACFPFFGCNGVAYATTTIYTDVLDDLTKDPSFNVANYPAEYPSDKNGYKLEVIQVAESNDDELFVYVYQSSAVARELTATSIDISTTVYEEIAFHNYHLKLLNRHGVFAKYLVEGLTVQREGTRYYAITDILRAWDKDLDKEAPGNNTISEVPYTVAKQWKFEDVNGKTSVLVVDIETIVVTDKFCGFVRYPDGFNLFKDGACDSHFVAFNTNRPIDKLLEADVYYTYQDWEQWGSGYIGTGGGWVTTYEDPKFNKKDEKEITVQSEQSFDYSGGGLFAGSFTWNRIESITDFIAGVDFNQQVYSGAFIDVSLASKLTDSAKTELKGKKWVLRFLETSYSHTETPVLSSYRYHNSGTIVGDVKILRLKFVTNGMTYNLGVVDNKQSGDPNNPVNDTQYKVEPKDWLERLWEIIKIILIVTAVIAAVVLIVWLIAKVVQMTKSTKVVIKGDVLPSKSREPSRPKSKKPKKSNKQPKRKAKRST